MKKKIVPYLVILAMVSACSGGEQPTDASQTNSIVGIWRYEYPTKPCVDTYEFAADGTVAVRSAEEVVSGNYSFKDTVPTGERHSLIINITADNGRPDCEGSTKNHVGFTNHVFVEFDTKSQIGWYPDHINPQPTITLELLP
jgi:hypothetical protein